MTATALESLFQGERPLSLRSIPFPAALRLLFLGPHPDDFDAIGITMRLLHENGNHIDVGVVRSGSGVQDSYCSPPTLEAKAALREQEQRVSCRFFGLPDDRLTFLDLEQDKEAQPLICAENLRRLRSFILGKQPEIVFMPHGNDTNTGHQRMYSMLREIASEADYPLAGCFNKDPKTIAMRMDLYTTFGEPEARWKAQLLRFHDSQHQRNLNTRGHGLDDRILNVNQQFAQEIGFGKYAEVFELALFGGGKK
jgi:LmbE family N-acetylglucosaminyl deacetylase